MSILDISEKKLTEESFTGASVNETATVATSTSVDAEVKVTVKTQFSEIW